MLALIYFICAVAFFMIMKSALYNKYPNLQNYMIQIDILFVSFIILLGSAFYVYNSSSSKCLIERFDNEKKLKYYDVENKQIKEFESYQDEYLNPQDKALKEKRIEEEEISKKIRSTHNGEMKYTSINPLNTIPLGEDPTNNDYVFIPPSKWMRPFERPPVCIADKKCPVCPSLPHDTQMNLLQFDDLVPPKIVVNNDYINHKQNEDMKK